MNKMSQTNQTRGEREERHVFPQLPSLDQTKWARLLMRQQNKEISKVSKKFTGDREARFVSSAFSTPFIDSLLDISNASRVLKHLYR